MFASLSVAFQPRQATAAPLQPRSLTLQSGTADSDSNGIPDGGSLPGGIVNHLFEFNVPTTATIGSISFQYCTTASGTCTLPTGVSTTNGAPNATALGANTGDITGFTLNSSTAGRPYLTRAAASGSGDVVVRLNNITNPTAANGETFFVRIGVHATTDATGPTSDSGTVAASTARAIELTGIMPESLIFCAAKEIDIDVNDIPQCSTALEGDVEFNQLFSSQSTTWATSQFAATTNAETGYAITVSGPSLKSGTNEIPAIGAVADISKPGRGQFGLNLVDNAADPTIGTASTNPITYYDGDGQGTGGAINPLPNGTNYRGQPSAPFNSSATPRQFAFTANTANVIAASDNGGAGPTDAQRYTATYIVNVSGSQPAGTYRSTLTYICTPTF